VYPTHQRLKPLCTRKFCNHSDIWKPTMSPSGLSGLCSCVYDSLTLITFFFSHLTTKNTLSNKKKIHVVILFFFLIFHSVLIICFCYMNLLWFMNPPIIVRWNLSKDKKTCLHMHLILHLRLNIHLHHPGSFQLHP